MTIKKTLIRKRHSRKRTIIVAFSVAITVLAGTLAVLELTGTTYLLHERKAVSSDIAPPSKQNKPSDDKEGAAATPAAPPATNPAPSTASNSDPKEGDAPSAPTNQPLIAPYGDFVSNHHPGKDGSPSAETSVCVTTPGAKCYITFTSDMDPSIVKTLTSGTADGNGAVYWNWDVREAGFTNGKWHIKATATLNNKTESTSDPLIFEVTL